MKCTVITNLYYYSWLYNLESLQFRKPQDVRDDTIKLLFLTPVSVACSHSYKVKKKVKGNPKINNLFLHPSFERFLLQSIVFRWEK
jgi:hypothetical protein